MAFPESYGDANIQNFSERVTFCQVKCLVDEVGFNECLWLLNRKSSNVLAIQKKALPKMKESAPFRCQSNREADACHSSF